MEEQGFPEIDFVDVTGFRLNFDPGGLDASHCQRGVSVFY